jgi:hypothetical protein
LSSQAVVLCEGYHDRAFWTGLLLHLDWADPQRGTSDPVVKVYDPDHKRVAGGEFGFYHQRGASFVRLVPCGGDLAAERAKAEKFYLPGGSDLHVRRLVFCVDADVGAGSNTSAPGLDDLRPWLASSGLGATPTTDGDLVIAETNTTISMVVWSAPDPPLAGVPAKQTLERLVCASLAAVNGAQADAVQAWLDSRPSAPEVTPKEHAWSYMAGWHAEHGCDYFYRGLWDAPAVVAELRSRLEAIHAWRIAEALAE